MLCTLKGKERQVILDQLRTVDKARLVKRLGSIGQTVQEQVLLVLGEIFAK